MELISHHQLKEFRKGLKEALCVRPLPRIPLASIHLGWADVCATRKDSELEWLAKDHLETKPITIKPETASHPAEQFSWVLLPYFSPPGTLSNKISCFVSTCVSEDNSFLFLLDKSPVSGPGRDPSSCNTCVESSLVLLEDGVCYDQCVLLAKLC